MRPLQRRSAASLAISIAIHVALAVALGSIVWKYPLGQMMGIRRTPITPERLHYIELPSSPTQTSGGGGRETTPGARPAPLRAPPATPSAVAVPSPTAADSGRSQAAGGTGDGRGAGSGNAATGVVPQQPDPRIVLNTQPFVRPTRSVAEDVDSIVSLAIGIYRDSMAIAAGKRKPGEWTVKGEDGKVWGWDQQGIRLGKFTIPNALLALLPLNTAGGGSPIEARSLAYIRRDVLENAQRAISEDEFRAAVKRIRERKDRERREKLLADHDGTTP